MIFHIIGKKEGDAVGEKERLRRRREALNYSRKRGEGNRQGGEETKAFFLFRAYVTLMIVAITMALSFVHTDYTQKLTANIKKAIAYQIPSEKLQQAGTSVMVWVHKVDLPVFRNKQEKTKQQNQEEIKQTTPTSEEIPKEDMQDFQPDLADDGEIP